MAQLTDTIVQGNLRATDSLLATTGQFSVLRAPTASNGTTYGPGTNGHMLRSNGTSIYWGALALSDIPIINIIVDCGTLGSSSTTAEQVISKSVSDSRITSNMTVIHGEFGDPNAFEEQVTCTSSNGSITIATKLYAGKTSTLTLTLAPTG